MKFFGAAVFGVLGLASTLFAVVWPWLGPFLLMASIPFWLLFLVFVVRSLRP